MFGDRSETAREYDPNDDAHRYIGSAVDSDGDAASVYVYPDGTVELETLLADDDAYVYTRFTRREADLLGRLLRAACVVRVD